LAGPSFEWRRFGDDFEEFIERVVLANEAIALTLCAGAIASSVTIVGGITLGGPCSVKLFNLVDALDALRDKFEERDSRSKETNAQASELQKCIADHKLDP
jgi:hypothetical protein